MVLFIAAPSLSNAPVYQEPDILKASPQPLTPQPLASNASRPLASNASLMHSAPMSHPLVRLAPLFRKSKALLLVGVCGLLAGAMLNVAGPWIIARAIDVDFANRDKAGLVIKGLLFCGILVANVAVTYGSRIVLEVVGQRAMFRLKLKLFDHLVDHDLAFHDRHTSGKLITRVQGDTEALRVLFAEVLLAFPADICLFIGMFTVIWFTAPAVAPLVFAVIPPYVVLFIIFRHFSPPRFLALRRVLAQLTGFVSEHLRAMPVLQTFGREKWAREQSEALYKDIYRTELVAHLQPVWYINSVVLTRALGIVLLLWIGAGLVAEGDLTVGGLVMGLAYLRLMFNPLMRLSFQLTTIERARAAAIRIAKLLDWRRTIVDPRSPQPWPGVGTGMGLDAVGFFYDEGTPVLTDVDLDIPAGANVGIVGATGAGKTTILNLLLRFRDPTEGRVAVGGADLRDLSVEDLRAHIGLVLQDVHLFPGTILDNLGGDVDQARTALDVLGLDDFPLEQQITEGGSNLSRGERQLLTFARALINDPDILVLDEATSAVDPATEVAVQEALERLQSGRTTVIVAHRLATVRHCDRIYVMGHGQVQEVGTHDELMAQNGVYAALSRLQEEGRT